MEQPNNNNKGNDLVLTIIFTIVAFGIYWLITFLVDLDIFEDTKRTILFAIVSLCSGYGLMRAYKYGEKYNG